MTTPATTVPYAASLESYALNNDKAVSPAAERNKQVILEALQSRLPAAGLLMEIGSGSGQHVAHLAPAFPGITFQVGG